MENISYDIKIGEIACKVITDGQILTPGPPTPATKGMPDMENGRILDVLCLFLNIGNHKVLIDTGCGNNFQATTGKLVQNLQKCGIRCSDIDTIIHSHGHTDHVRGSFDAQGKLVFPNARYIVARKEWESWADPQLTPGHDFLFEDARKNYLSMRDQFELIEDNAEAIPGIKVKLAPGHSPGNSLLEISSNGKTMICLGDTMHDPLEFVQPDYYSFLDVDPQQGVRSRTQVPAEIAQAGTLVFACHFAFPGLGYFVPNGKFLGWKPIV